MTAGGRSGPFFLGVDFGTSGVRACVVDSECNSCWWQAFTWSESETTSTVAWRTALFDLLSTIPLALRPHLQALAINGTSATVVLLDGNLLNEVGPTLCL